MTQQNDMFDFEKLRETVDIEAKLATGQDGCGKIPDSLWSTYSAMANTEGGIILLGAEELSDGRIVPHNVENVEKLLRDFWNTINNPQKVNNNILSDKNVFVCEISDKIKIIQIHVPRATRLQKPIYVGQNPLTGTYLRNHEGDFRCPSERVRQMLAEQGSDTRDLVICSNYDLQDVDMPTFQAYRQRMATFVPDHVFNSYDDIEFLHQIGGWRRDRNTGEEGLTIAGLLMFGKLRSILDNIPNYILDYQERPRAVTEMRWIDRVTTDGKWSGNLFSFYQIVIKKLFADLKIPFSLDGSTTRVDDTPVHKAIREALVNTLIHADYSGMCSILVVKRPDLFGFRNPGTLRIPRAEVLRGGTSDCRNRNLQKMFQLVGLAEQAGSGFPKICYGWQSQSWKVPELEERFDTNQTVLALRMENLLPENAVALATKELGTRFKKLNKLERLAVVTAYSESCISHNRLMEISKDHAADISAALHSVVKKKCLDQSGKGRGTIYFPLGRLPKKGEVTACEPSPANVASSNVASSNVASSNVASSNVASSNVASSNVASSNVASIDERTWLLLLEIAAPARSKKRIPREGMISLILKLCQQEYLSAEELARLLSRDAKSLRNNVINELVKGNRLKPKYPTKTHPDQRYRSTAACKDVHFAYCTNSKPEET